MKRPLTTGQIAKYCHVTYWTVIKWIQEGKLNAYQLPGGHNRVMVEDFIKFLDEYKMPVNKDAIIAEISREEKGAGKKKILVVDDDAGILKLVDMILGKNKKYFLESARDGFEAGSKLVSFKPDLILLDIRMPGLDGFEVCRKVKSSREMKDTRILVLTAYPEDGNIERMMEIGADDYLVKPFEAEDLRKKVTQLLGKTRKK